MLTGRTLLFGAGCSENGDRPAGTSVLPGLQSTDSGADDSDSSDPVTGDTASDAIDTTPITSPECDNEGELYCNFECILPIDDDNCGGCNVRCSAGTVCKKVEGVYDCHCPEGTVRCGNTCIDPLTNGDFCGAAGTCSGTEAGADCGSGGECVAGACQCDATHTKCGDACVDTLSSVTFCSPIVGDCGSECLVGGICTDGICGCPTDVPDVCAEGCVDFLTDNNNCGKCGEMCDTAGGYACISGSCQCATGTEVCDGACVNTKADVNNCGGCVSGSDTDTGGVACATDEGCFDGACISKADVCGAAVMGSDVCDGLPIRTKSMCTNDLEFEGGGLKCDNNESPGANVIKGTSLCYQILDVQAFEDFHCWWSGRDMTVNGLAVSCGDGNMAFSLPPASGNYCVYFAPSSVDGAHTDGFAIGTR